MADVVVGKTDEGENIAGTPAKPYDRDDIPRRDKVREDQAKKFGQNGGYQPKNRAAEEINGTKANCHGTTFDLSAAEIGEAEAAKILRDNFAKLDARNIDTKKRQKVHVCDILIWGSADYPAHSACVVEVDSEGKP